MISQSKKTKDNISFSLFRLMLKKGYEEISITELCELAEVSRTTFYRYFRDKKDIFLDFADERFAEFFEIVDSKYKVLTFYDIAFEIFNLMYAYRIQIIKLVEAGMQQVLLEQFHFYFRYLFRQSSLREINPEFSNIQSESFQSSTAFCAGGVFSLITAWAEQNMKETPEQMANHLIRTLKDISSIDPNRQITHEGLDFKKR